MIATIIGHAKDRTQLAVQFAAILAACIALGACAEIKVRAGDEINLPALQDLQIGKSTTADVQATLGAPFGTGRSYLPFQSEHLEMWSYYYELGTMSDDRRTFLFVYLDDGVYDGYMWFGSLPDSLK